MTPQPRFHFVCPGSLDQPTGGYRYDRRILRTLTDRKVAFACHELPGQFPVADAKTRSAAMRLWQRLGPDDTIVIDGLALPAFAQAVNSAGSRPRLVALVHHPLHLETGLSLAAAARLREQETALLRAADRIIVTSPASGDTVAGLGVGGVPISVVTPGTDKAPAAAGSGRKDLALLCVAALIPRKGHLMLLSVLAALCHLRWHLVCVGPMDRDAGTTAAVTETIGLLGLEGRVTLAGALAESDLTQRYAASDLFVLASRYEGYGMAFAEAMAHGLPIVASGAGAVRDTVPDSAGLVVPGGDRTAFAASLAAVLADRRLRTRLRAGAVAAGHALPDWGDQADRFLAAVLA